MLLYGEIVFFVFVFVFAYFYFDQYLQLNVVLVSFHHQSFGKSIWPMANSVSAACSKQTIVSHLPTLPMPALTRHTRADAI